jgi:hypothetical protein
MNWWRAYHGLPYDSKLAVVAKKCGVPRAEVLAVWIACLDFASQHEDRGTVQGIDAEELAVSLDLDEATVDRVLNGFRERDMISVTPRNATETQGVERITAWERRQVQRERDDDSSERVRRFRQKRTAKDLSTETPPSSHVTPRNAPEQNRTEQRREDTHTKQTACVRVADLDGVASQLFDELWQRWPRRTKKDLACQLWISFVTTDNEAAVMACADRYLASDEVSRNVVMNLSTWLEQQHRDGWGGEWPAASGAVDEMACRETEQLPTGCDRCNGEPYVITDDGAARCTCARGRELLQMDQRREREPQGGPMTGRRVVSGAPRFEPAIAHR